MASLEVLALDSVTPQIRAPGGADTYSVPKSMIMATTAGIGYWANTVGSYGIEFQVGSGYVLLKSNSRTSIRLEGTAPYGISVDYRVGLGVGVTSDVGIERIAAKVLKITDGGAATSSGSGVINLPVFTVANLPTAASAGAGGRSSVSDATQTFTSANFGAVVTGGGANFVPVVSDGTNWRIG